MLTFHPATPTDLTTLNAISVASKRHWGYPDAWIERWRPDLTVGENDLQAQNVLVARKDGEIIGFCSLAEGEQEYEVMHLWVLPEYIGRGMGKALLAETLARFAREPKPIRVESDPNAEAFYRKQGFVTFDRVESYPPGRFLPVMRRES